MTTEQRPRECQCYYTVIANEGDGETFVPKRDYEALRKELDELRNYFDDEEQRQTFGHLIRENAALKAAHEELLSYLPKVPTEPYERELGRKLATARAALEEKLAKMNCVCKFEKYISGNALCETCELRKVLGEIG